MVWLAENMAMALKIWKTAILARKYRNFAGHQNVPPPRQQKTRLTAGRISDEAADQYL